MLFLVQSPKDWYKDWGTGNNGMAGDCPNYSVVEIGQNTEKSPGDLKRLAVSQIPVNANVKNSQ